MGVIEDDGAPVRESNKTPAYTEKENAMITKTAEKRRLRD